MAAPVMAQDTVAAIMAVDMAAISNPALPLPRAVGHLPVIIHPRAAGHHKAITTDTTNPKSGFQVSSSKFHVVKANEW